MSKMTIPAFVFMYNARGWAIYIVDDISISIKEYNVYVVDNLSLVFTNNTDEFEEKINNKLFNMSSIHTEFVDILNHAIYCLNGVIDYIINKYDKDVMCYDLVKYVAKLNCYIDDIIYIKKQYYEA